MACCFFFLQMEVKLKRREAFPSSSWENVGSLTLGRSSSSRLPSWFGGGRCHATLAAACWWWWVYTHYRLQCRQGLLAPSVCLCVFCLLKARTHHSALLLSPLLLPTPVSPRPPLLEP